MNWNNEMKMSLWRYRNAGFYLSEAALLSHRASEVPFLPVTLEGTEQGGQSVQL